MLVFLVLLWTNAVGEFSKQIGWEISKELATLSGWKFSIYLTIKMQ
jgi:hypothetical protein